MNQFFSQNDLMNIHMGCEGIIQTASNSNATFLTLIEVNNTLDKYPFDVSRSVDKYPYDASKQVCLAMGDKLEHYVKIVEDVEGYLDTNKPIKKLQVVGQLINDTNFRDALRKEKLFKEKPSLVGSFAVLCATLICAIVVRWGAKWEAKRPNADNPASSSTQNGRHAYTTRLTPTIQRDREERQAYWHYVDVATQRVLQIIPQIAESIENNNGKEIEKLIDQQEVQH